MKENIYILITVAMLAVFMLMLLMILLHIKNQNRLLFQKRKMAEAEIEHQKELSKTLIVSQEAERKRIGMDLHDEVGTALSTLRMFLEQSTASAESNPQIQQLKKDSKEMIDNIIKNVRKISHNLSPFLKGAYEFMDALEDIIAAVNNNGNIEVNTDFADIHDFDFLSEETQLALYRVIAELINNTIKHANASNINISFLKTDTILTVTYADNGKGISENKKEKKGIGLMNIESRVTLMNGVYEIFKQPQSGFKIQLQIPI